MANTKVTKKEMFIAILALIAESAPDKDVDVLTKFVENEIALLDKRSANKTATKTQVENEGIKALILDTLIEIDKPVTISEMQTFSADLAKYTNQKLSALLTQMKADGTVIKTVEKKKSYFSANSLATKTIDITAEEDVFEE